MKNKMDDIKKELKCSICKKEYNNDTGLLIQPNIKTGELVCLWCAEKEQIKGDE